ncbi:MAG: hypothetical protein PF574_08570 [Candidatus Delongbacteria bacterium]|jgi:hypothetical protein|nr:hypothetical protein [Candidatus Delongbacteria bacterium]
MKHLLLIIVLIFFSYAYSKTIFGTAEYVYGDAETLLDAKAKCMSLAKQDAIEKFATFISSESVVRNYVTERSEIVTNAQGLITDIKVIQENISKANSKIFYKISAEIDEEKILAIYEEKEKFRLEKVEAERLKQHQRLEAERKAQAEKLEHERKMAEINYKTKEIESSMLLNTKEKRFWRNQKWIALGAFVGSAGLGTYFNFQADSYYDDYQSATNTVSSIDYYDKANSNKDYRNITYSVSLVPLGYFFWSWYQESKY